MVGGLFESMAENYRNNLPEAIMNYASFSIPALNKQIKQGKKKKNKLLVCHTRSSVSSARPPALQNSIICDSNIQ